MSTIAVAVKHMLAAGMDHEAVVSAVAEMETETRQERTPRQERNRRYYEKQASEKRLKASESVLQDAPLDKEKVAPKETKPLKENPPKGGQKKSFATRIPDDFAPDIEWAVAHGLSRQTAQFQAEKFRNYWLGAKQGAKADWPATWRNWVLSHIERSGADAPIQASSESSDEQWSKRLIYARKERVWSTSEWGAPPGAPGCRVPRQLVEPGDGDGWKEWVKAA